MATATEQPKAPAAQDHPYPPGVVPYPQPYSPPFPPPPGYQPFFAYPPPPDGAHPENSPPPVPPHPYMMAFAPGMVYAYPPPPGTAFSPPAASVPPALGKPKRKQVKMACTNCAAACKRCDESRPCERCVKYGMSSTCVDGQRKERKKGIKRGPYKRKNKSDGSGTYPPGQPPPPSTAPPAPIPVPHQFPPEGFYPVYYGPPGPFLPHPGATADTAQQPTNPDGTPVQPPPLPGHPPVGVNGQPPTILPPYFYPYPPFTHYPPMPFPPPPGLAPPPPGSQQVPPAAPPGETTPVATGGATAPASSVSASAPAINADTTKDGEAPTQDQDTPPDSTASTSSVGPATETSQPLPPATPAASTSSANTIAAAINTAAATATTPAIGGKKRTRGSVKVNGTSGEVKPKRAKRSAAMSAPTIAAATAPLPVVAVVTKDGGVRPQDIEGRHGPVSLGLGENGRQGGGGGGKDTDAEGEVIDELNENGSGSESSG